MEKIRRGVKRFQTEVFPQRRRLYEEVAAQQSPRVLFITCGDSRKDPELLTGSGPGEIFVERTSGNRLPNYDEHARVGVSASIEYAVVILQVKHIIICGHSDCGAMKGVWRPEKYAAAPAAARWLTYALQEVTQLNQERPHLGEKDRLDRMTQLNVIEQMAHLKTHPSAAEKIKTGEVTVHGWVYEIPTAQIRACNPATGAFEPWPA